MWHCTFNSIHTKKKKKKKKMAYQTRVEQGQVVIQSGHNQLIITSIENVNDIKVVSLLATIETFVLNRKSDLLAILQVDKQWTFYRLTSGTIFETKNKIEPKSFQLALLHSDSFWLGQLQAKSLSFNVQQFNENVSYECSVQLQLEDQGSFELVEYVFFQDQLVCALVGRQDSVIEQFRLSNRQVELVRSHKVKDKRITKVECNANNGLLIFVTEDNTVHLLENESVTMWRVKSKLEIKTICFDVNFDQSFWIATESVLFLLYYISIENQIVVLETMNSKTNCPVVASQIPLLFTLTGNAVSSEQCKQLTYLQTYQKIIIDMFALDYKQFVRHLHNSDYSDSALWRAIAKRCLVENDIQSAIYCSAKMKDARFARSLHEMAFQGQSAVCALLALNLGLSEEAEKILEHDSNALSKICQLQNKWNDAFLTADKIQIKSVYYSAATAIRAGWYLEEENKINEAIKFYEMSGNVLEVPRMLFESGNISQLEEYCLKPHKNDKTNTSLVIWWGQYCESQGDHKTALEMYESVADYYNLVRLMCHVGQAEMAIKLVNEYIESRADKGTNNADMTAAMLYLGKHLEAMNSTESIHYYLHCGAIRHAIRMCITTELYDELISIAVQYCDQTEAKHILRTYCTPNQALVREENLVKLYYKCGLAKEAIMLAIDSQLWSQLREICESELSHESRDFVIPDQVLHLALQALKSDTSIIDIVIDLIIMSSTNNFSLITQTIKDYGINVDDQLMDKLERYMTNQKNSALVDTFAELCLEKGNYQLAAKLYNKIGKRVDSLKALIRSGNVEKVVQFANVARDKTVFKMAANFLQTVNYEDTALIIKFYTRAEAFQELDRFKSELDSR